MTTKFDNKKFLKKITVSGKSYSLFHLPGLSGLGLGDPNKLPFSIKVLLESALRNFDNYQVTFKDIETILKWSAKKNTPQEIAYKPGRVILQDFTGVPCVVDLAAMRAAMKRLGGDVRKINPLVRCDLIIDHSLQVDKAGTPSSFSQNLSLEFQRNKERYAFLKWGQKAFKNFTVIPPATGIIHQINLEALARGVLTQKTANHTVLYPDSLIGTDSHTTMINGLGLLGWGVGGIEAEAVMLGEPIHMLLPEVIGVKLTGALKSGVTATDLVLTIVEKLRQKGVVGKFVEFYGEGIQHLSLPDRAVVSNMGPEYGATIGLFPIDDVTLNYYRLTGRAPQDVDRIERYYKEQNMFYNPSFLPSYSGTLTIDMSKIEPCLAGPKRPQDRIPLKKMPTVFKTALTQSIQERGFGLEKKDISQTVPLSGTSTDKLKHGSIVLASITSCTNTSNPALLMTAGLLARNAVAKGLKVKKYIKTSFIPGSQAVEKYLKKADLLKPLEKLKFHIVGYGCATCIGNSGPLPDKIVKAIQKKNLTVCSVLSGNRNFEGRVSPHTKGNFLASPPLVLAYALAGHIMFDFEKTPLGHDTEGHAVFLKDIWPRQEEIEAVVANNVIADMFTMSGKERPEGLKQWAAVKSKVSDLYAWEKKSTYIQEPPFFTGMKKETTPIQPIQKARVLLKLGDSVTTDHISPAGNIAANSPAGKYLKTLGVNPRDFNSYGSRRGNDRVMTRGTFANIRLRNELTPGKEGSWTIHFPSGQIMSVYDAAQEYTQEKTPLIILAGKEYGTGSSRDWAAKGTALLGVRAVLAESYERIHRSNLAGMGILPLQFKESGTGLRQELKGDETFYFDSIDEKLAPLQETPVTAVSPQGRTITFKMIVRLDTPVEIDYYRHGGILPMVIRKLLGKGKGRGQRDKE